MVNEEQRKGSPLVAIGGVVALLALGGAVAAGLWYDEDAAPDDAAWVKAEHAEGARVLAYTDYLKGRPEGRHAAAARAAIEAVYTQAEANVNARAATEVAPALLELVRTLRAGHTWMVGVVVRPVNAFDASQLPAGVVDPAEVFRGRPATAREADYREQQVLAPLQKALDGVLGAGVARLVLVPEPRPKGPAATLVLDSELHTTGDVYEVSARDEKGGPLLALAPRGPQRYAGLEWTWKLALAAAPAAEPRSLCSATARPASDLRWMEYGDGLLLVFGPSMTAPYEKMAASAYDALGVKIAEQLRRR